MKQLLPQLKRSRKPSEVVDPMLLDEVEERKSIFESAIKKTLAEEKFRFKTNFRIADHNYIYKFIPYLAVWFDFMANELIRLC